MSIMTVRIPKIDVGTPTTTRNYQSWDTVEVHFHGFEDLPAATNDQVESPVFACFGHRWLLRLYPGGNSQSYSGNISIYLKNRSDKGISIEYGIRIKTGKGKEKFDLTSSRETTNFAPSGECWG